MKSFFVFALCILAFVSSQDVTSHNFPSSNSAISSPTRSHKTPPPRHTAVLKSSGKVPTSYPTRRTCSVTDSQKRSQKTHTIAPKSPTASLKTSVKPTTGTTSRKPKSPASRASYPTSTTPKSSPPPATTPTNLTTTRHSTGTSATSTLQPVISVTKTVTVSKGHTASAQIGWMVVGVGVGGAVAVGNNILSVAGGLKGIIEVGSSGQVEVDPIETATTLTRTSTSHSSSPSSSSTASPTPYNIYPKLDSTLPQQSTFAQDLERIAQPGSVIRITGGRDQLLLWVASLTAAQASELSRNPVIRGINVDQPLPVDLETETASDVPPSPECPPESCSHRKRDGPILMQQSARDELKVISQSSGTSLSELPGYAYDARGGRGVTVYVIDTGITPDHREFRNMPGRLRWLYLPGKPEVEGDDNGHGTCVASKVASPTFGVAKNANLVVVRVDAIVDQIQTSSAIAAWGVVARDITLKGLQGKAVVSSSFSLNAHYYISLSENERNIYRAGIRELIDLDAVLVVSSGNIRPENPGPELATYPSLFANELPIVVVGGVDTSGVRGAYSQGLPAQLTVSAVGRVACASRQGRAKMKQGTSVAVPAVAGLAAYFLSLDHYRGRLLVPGSVARNVRDLIQSLAYARLPNQPVLMWNGIDSRQIYCPVRRDVGSSGCPARNTTLPIVTPVTPIPIPNPRPPGTTTGMSTTSVTSSTTTDSSTTYDGRMTLTYKMTISAYDGTKSTITEITTIN